ncbi:unnamed protein product [Bursaphelenchus xylophilus]|uniref:(pine wood nematode) hypothetical protein n=1 Tax=Bursaphelenchus xylophilus TaxID=6326 RepID=A0A1I7S3N8_BURXY|nr:unnamed protein product [Bursaphelenchus xylophilus]CAG9116433.1 unnamed protein product [Bursaphelenchus xylophilus]
MSNPEPIQTRSSKRRLVATGSASSPVETPQEGKRPRRTTVEKETPKKDSDVSTPQKTPTRTRFKGPIESDLAREASIDETQTPGTSFLAPDQSESSFNADLYKDLTEKEKMPVSLYLKQQQQSQDKKDKSVTEDEKEMEKRVMELLEGPEVGGFEEEVVPLDRREDMIVWETEGEKGNNVSLIMSNEELKMAQELPEEVRNVLDKFNSREIEKYEDLLEALRGVVTEGYDEISLLQFLEYRRLVKPPSASENAKDLTDEEIADFVGSLSQESAYFLDLFNHQVISGLNTVGIIVGSQSGLTFTTSTVQKILDERRKINPPPVDRGHSEIVVTAGYLSHDYWPSLLCVPDGEHYCRYFNLTNTRNDGFHRYYRCSKCCTLKNVIDQQNKRGDMPHIDFVVPKIQIHGDSLVTDLNALEHHEDCKSMPIPVMLAEQLDRRARRQVSLGLMAPREAWTDAYFEALRIADTVSAYHPSFRLVAEIFPSYDVCRGQYSRNFHKLKRRLSMPLEFEPMVDKRKIVQSSADVLEIFESPSSSDPKRKRLLKTSSLRRGREADERFNQMVPETIKNEMAPGYISVEENSVYYYDGNEYYGPVVEEVSMEDVEQEEVVVTDDQHQQTRSQGPPEIEPEAPSTSANAER